MNNSSAAVPDTEILKPELLICSDSRLCTKYEIVATGPGKVSDAGNTISMTVKVGDNVLYGKYSGTEITLEGNEVLIMRESDILAVL